MKDWKLFILWFLSCASAAVLLYELTEPRTCAERPIYSESADGSKQIAEALAAAKTEHKRVLLQFGANWCVWCHRLHCFCQTNPRVKKTLHSSYVTVFIDVNNGHNESVALQYAGSAGFGIPFVVILDSTGIQTSIGDNRQFVNEYGEYSEKKILAFLGK